MTHAEDFADSGLERIYQDLQSGALPAALIDREEDEESRSRLTRLLLSPAAGSTDEMIAMASDCLVRIQRTQLEKEFSRLTAEMSSASPDRLPDLLAEVRQISDMLKKLK